MITAAKKARRNRIITVSVIFLVILILAIILYFTSRTTDCKSDISCFDRMLSMQRPAKFTDIDEGVIYQYTSKQCNIGSSNKKGNMEIKLLKLQEGSSQELKSLFEGKEMCCNIPKENLTATYLRKEEETLDYCSGPLKEAMYELMLRKLYTVIAKNIGSIATEMRNALLGK